MPAFFYFSVEKRPADMSDDELVQEINAARRYENRCAEIGQGVNTKEFMRRRNCEHELVLRPGGIDLWNALVDLKESF